MKKIMIFAAFAAALSLASCQQEGLNEVVKNDPSAVSESPVFTGTINAGTKTTVDATEGKVSWETTDEITVTDKDQKTAVYSIESIDGTTGRATFVYKSGDTLGEGPYTATYGTEPATVQTYSATPGKIYMTAPETSTNSFNFTVQCALMEINLTKSGESVSSVAVTGTPTDGTETTYILTCTEAQSIESTKSFYIAVPAGVYNKIVITDSDDKVCTLTAASGITVANNHIKPLTFVGSKLDFIPDPLPAIREAAFKELEAKKMEADNRMNKKAEGYKLTEEVHRVIEQGDEKIMYAKQIAITNIEEATDESTIQKEKDNGLNAMEEETLKALTDIPNAIASYKVRMKNEINYIAMNAQNTISALGVYSTVEDQARNEIDKAVAAAETNIDNATSEDDVNKAINNAQNIINQQLANVQAYYESLQAAKQAANVDVDKAAADAEDVINKAAEGYGNIETVQHVVVTSQIQLRDLKDNAQLSINEETNLDEVGQLKENTIQHIKTEQDKALAAIEAAIQEFIALQQNTINEVEQVAATAKGEINGLGVDEIDKSDAKAQIDNIVNTAKTTINEATDTSMINEAKTRAISEIYTVVQNLKDM